MTQFTDTLGLNEQHSLPEPMIIQFTDTLGLNE